jgi:pyrimidine oxygenase
VAGQEHFTRRYDMLSEYAQVLRDLWETGHSDLKGDYFEMTDCRVKPLPSTDMKIICAGSSDEGWPFQPNMPIIPSALARGQHAHCLCPVNDRLAAATAKTGRKVETFVLMMVIADESDEAAQAKWQHYRDGVDEEAVAWLREQGRPMPCRRPRMSTSWPLRNRR